MPFSEFALYAKPVIRLRDAKRLLRKRQDWHAASLKSASPRLNGIGTEQYIRAVCMIVEEWLKRDVGKEHYFQPPQILKRGPPRFPWCMALVVVRKIAFRSIDKTGGCTFEIYCRPI